MHPLALEDLLHFRKNARSKVDYYNKHLFLRVLCHTLCSDEEAATGATPPSSMTDLPRSSSPVPMDADEEDEASSWEDRKDRVDEEITDASRWTSRNSTLRNTVKRKLSRNADVESHPMTPPSARFSVFPDLKVRSIPHLPSIYRNETCHYRWLCYSRERMRET